MRSEWCREHIDETAKQCGLGKSVVADVKLASRFCTDHSDMSEFSTRAILALIRIRDDPLRDNVISSISKSLESGRHPLTGKILKTKKLSETDIRKVIEQADREMHSELTKKSLKERNVSSSSAPKSTESSLRPKPSSLLAKEVDATPVPAQSQPTEGPSTSVVNTSGKEGTHRTIHREMSHSRTN